MIEFRWLVKEQTDMHWDEQVTNTLRSKPILQYRFDHRHAWMDVPTVIQKVK